MSLDRAAPWLALTATAGAALGFAALAFGGAGASRPVTVESVPPSASVFVDGVFRGVTPLGLGRLPPGTHAFRVERAGFRTAFGRIDESGGSLRGPVRLEPLPTGGLDVRSEPPGADVYVDGEFRGVTPISLEGVRPGVRRLRVEKTNHTPASAAVTVASGTTTVQALSLEDRVLDFLTQAIGARPREVYPYMELGHYYCAVGEVKKGIETYRRGLNVGWDESLRACTSNEGDLNSIRAQCKRLERQLNKDCQMPAPTGPKVRILAALAKRELGRLHPKKVIAKLTQARHLEKAGQTEGAAAAVAEIVEGSPGHPLLWRYLVGLRASSGDVDAAVQTLAKGFEAVGDGAEPKMRLAETFLGDHTRFGGGPAAERVFGLCAEALAGLREEMRGPDALRLAKLEAEVLREAGRDAEALARLDAALLLEVGPAARSRVELEKGRLLVSMGRLGDAEGVYRRLAAEAPEADVRSTARGEIRALQDR